LGIEGNLVEKGYSFKSNIKVCLQGFREAAGLIGRARAGLSRKKTTRNIGCLGAEI
jgi:hypothetical protein